MSELPKLTTDILVASSGAVLSLLMYIIPPFRRWLDEKVGEWKFLFMALFLLVVAAGYTLIYCRLAWACILGSLEELVVIWIAALLANQGAYKAVVEPLQNKAEKAAELASYK
jgi:fatty acid desaturase